MLSLSFCSVVLLFLGALVGSASAFVTPPYATQSAQRSTRRLDMTATGERGPSPYCRKQSILFSTPSEDEPSATETAASNEASTTTETTRVATKETEEEGTQYPLNVPSPLLLASAMVLAIISTGSVFQLASGSPPPLGSAATAVIAVIGVPSCIFLLYAAILKGIAETEEDDKAFLSGK